MHLRALEVFEAAARLGDASAAARELHISRSAVNQHIRKLEERIGAPLFEHGARPARPTKAARELLPTVTAALDMVDAACARAARPEGRVVVSAMPSDATAWLLPRMAKFRRAFPDILLVAQSAMSFADFNAGEADAALRYGRGEYAGLFTEKLADEFIAPFASPDYLARHSAAAPEDLPRLALIDDRAGDGFECHEWRGWLARLGVSIGAESIVLCTTYADQALCLAKSGEGVALGRGLLTADDLQNGLLAPALPFSTRTGLSYYLVHPFSARTNSNVSRFAEWLRAEFDAHKKTMREFFPPPREGGWDE